MLINRSPFAAIGLQNNKQYFVCKPYSAVSSRIGIRSLTGKIITPTTLLYVIGVQKFRTVPPYLSDVHRTASFELARLVPPKVITFLYFQVYSTAKSSVKKSYDARKTCLMSFGVLSLRSVMFSINVCSSFPPKSRVPSKNPKCRSRVSANCLLCPPMASTSHIRR